MKHDVSKETKTRQKSRAYEDSQSAINWWKQVRFAGDTEIAVNRVFRVS